MARLEQQVGDLRGDEAGATGDEESFCHTFIPMVPTAVAAAVGYALA
jgi:hypothetical protein